MPQLFPFAGYYVNPARVNDVVGPPYDQLTPKERAEFAAAHPDNYINTMRSLEEFPADERPDITALLKSNAAKLNDLIQQGAFTAAETPCMFLYRLTIGDHSQIGVVAEVAIDDYAQGRLKIHEHTRTDHEDNLTLYHEIVGAHSSPVCVTYPAEKSIDDLVRKICEQTEPVLDFTMRRDGVRQTIWCVETGTTQNELIQAFQPIINTYLTDGHHRAASGWRHAQKQRQANPDFTGEEPFNRLLVALFPHDQLRILAFNRCVADINGGNPQSVLDQAAEHFQIDKLTEPEEPGQPGDFTVLLDNSWYRFSLRQETMSSDPVAALDVSRLYDCLLKPVLGIEDMRTDPRLGYVPGSLGCAGLQEKIEQGWELGIICYPTSIEQLMAIADANAVMPPKSTWFDPKARSGVFLSLHR